MKAPIKTEMAQIVLTALQNYCDCNSISRVGDETAAELCALINAA